MSNLSVGIVGLPNVGKSTLFNALASRRLAETAPRPFTTIDPHEAVVPVPDNDLDKLSWLIKPNETVPATVTFIDIAGLVKGAHKGEGLGNQFLAKIREVDALVHVVRAFYDPQVVHSDLSYEMGSLEQIEYDIEIVNIELELGGIGQKPVIIVLNVGEDDISSSETERKIIVVTEKFKTDTIAISAKIEEELTDFSNEERSEYLIHSGISETGFEKFIKKAYVMLDLITFYTIKPSSAPNFAKALMGKKASEGRGGGNQVTAWSIKRGSSAIDAAEKVHTDFVKGFIKAEVISVDQLLNTVGWKEAKEKGLIRLEGKNYVVQDKDVIEFKVSQ